MTNPLDYNTNHEVSCPILMNTTLPSCQALNTFLHYFLFQTYSIFCVGHILVFALDIRFLWTLYYSCRSLRRCYFCAVAKLGGGILNSVLQYYLYLASDTDLW